MKMDLTTAILGLVSLLIFVVPFVAMYFNRVRIEKLMLKPLEQLATQHGCSLNQHEYCADFIIGMDEQKGVVFFYKQNKQEAGSQLADLKDIEACKVLKKTRNAASSSGSITLLEGIALGFIPKDKSKREIRFELYDDKSNKQLEGELQIAEKWSALVNNYLANKK